MSITFAMPAPEGSRFEPGAFDAQVGKVVPLRFESFMGMAEMSGLITAAVVARDGSSVEITFEPAVTLAIDCSTCGRPMSEHTGDECPPPL